jgi:iron-sulfur cluster assembly protein
MTATMLTITDKAAKRVKALIARSDKPVQGLRVGVTTRGCNGMSYTVDYVNERQPGDELIEDKGVKIFVDPMAVMYIIGSEMDYTEDKFQTGFTFNNPNAKSFCGCGESFSI